MEDQEGKQETKAKCAWCEYEGDKRQVNMHQLNCKHKPPEQPKEDKAPERERPKVDRKERIPFSIPRRRLNAPSGDGYHYRIFNDNWRKEPGRIQRALEAGYEKVGSFESLSVGTNEDGSEIKGILMRIPQELYEEDQKSKQEEVDKVDEAIRGGKLEEGRNDKRYIPQGIKIYSNQNENG